MLWRNESMRKACEGYTKVVHMAKEQDLSPIGQRIVERFRELGIPDEVCSHPCILPFISGRELLVITRGPIGEIHIFGVVKKSPGYVELRKVLAKLYRWK